MITGGALTSSSSSHHHQHHHQPQTTITTTTTSTTKKRNNHKKKNDNRIILHFDYDCFYASVFENLEPRLRARPLGIQQKSILATCNYAARARGVRKLMSVAEGRRVCPDLVLRNGEDLAPFRDASRRLWGAFYARVGRWRQQQGSGSGGGKAVSEVRMERLGLDEVFVDVTDAVAYNMALLNPNVGARRDSFFHLSPTDPEDGFVFDATRFCGCVYPSSTPTTTTATTAAAAAAAAAADNKLAQEKDREGDGDREEDIDIAAAILDHSDPTHVRLMLGSHLAGHLRRVLESDFGHTPSAGISTNKALAKLAGNVNKPRNQTVLVPVQVQEGGRQDTIQEFLDAHPIRQIPGIGSRISALIQEYLFAANNNNNNNNNNNYRERENPFHNNSTTVRAVLHHRDHHPTGIMSCALLNRILDRPGLERGVGTKVWGLLHGIDPSEVKRVETSDSSSASASLSASPPIPAQISVEDTYMARPLNGVSELVGALNALAEALVGRLWGELTAVVNDGDGGGGDGSATTAMGSGEEGEEDGTSQIQTETQKQKQKKRWLAHPPTLRLSTRALPRPRPPTTTTNTPTTTSTNNPSFSRNTRSQALPTFVFDLTLDRSAIAERLVREALLPLFRRLHTERQGGGWNLALLNVGVTNMVVIAADGDAGGGGGGGSGASARNISWMFRTQEEKLREWTAYNDGVDDHNDHDNHDGHNNNGNDNGGNGDEKDGYDGNYGDNETTPLRPQPQPQPEQLHPRHHTSNSEHDSDDKEKVAMEVDVDDDARRIPSGKEDTSQGTAFKDGDDGVGIAVYDDSDWEEGNVWEENDSDDDNDNNDDDYHDDGGSMQKCPRCGLAMPIFAMSAHDRFHAMGG